MALGNGAAANQANTIAIGANVKTTQANQVAIGNSANTYRLAGIASQASAAAQSGATAFVTTDANGNLAASAYGPSTIAGLGNRIDSVQAQVNNLEAKTDSVQRYAIQTRKEARQGVAMAIAMATAPMPSAPGKTTWATNGATYRGEWDTNQASSTHRTLLENETEIIVWDESSSTPHASIQLPAISGGSLSVGHTINVYNFGNNISVYVFQNPADNTIGNRMYNSWAWSGNQTSFSGTTVGIGTSYRFVKFILTQRSSTVNFSTRFWFVMNFDTTNI